MDLLQIGKHLVALAAIEERDLVAAGQGVVHDDRPEEARAAEHQDPELPSAVVRRGCGARGPAEADRTESGGRSGGCCGAEERAA